MFPGATKTDEQSYEIKADGVGSGDYGLTLTYGAHGQGWRGITFKVSAAGQDRLLTLRARSGTSPTFGARCSSSPRAIRGG